MRGEKIIALEGVVAEAEEAGQCEDIVVPVGRKLVERAEVRRSYVEGNHK